MNNQTEITTPDYQDYRNWIKALGLKIADINAQLEYAYATGFCSNCPANVNDDDWRFGLVCCRETGEFEQDYESDEAYIRQLTAAQEALKVLIPEDEH